MPCAICHIRAAGARHSDASGEHRRTFPFQPTYFTVSRALLYIRRSCRVSFYVRASLASSVAISITASTGELCCKEPRFGSHSIRPLGQRTGACLSGSRRIPLGMNTFSPTCGRSSVILTPMENASLAYFVVIVRLFRYGSELRCSLFSLPTSQSPARRSPFGDLAVSAFTLEHRSHLLWQLALQLPQVSFAAKNPVLAHTASCRYISGLALACRASSASPLG